MLKKAAALFLVGASLATWTSCGTTSSRYVYAAIPAASQIVAYREDPNSGVLTPLTGSPITAGPAVQSLVIHPSQKFLYAANSGESDISLFTIATSGALTEVTPRTPAGGTTPTILVTDSAGSFLYVANSGSNNLSVFSISASSGALSQVQGSPFPLGISPLNMKLSPSGNVLYITGAGNPGIVEVWTVTSGSLSSLAVVPVHTNPYGLAIDPSGSHLYVANTGDNTISEFTVASGSLSEISGSPIGETYSAPLALLVDSSGKYLYVANEGSSNLAAYTIGTDGSLTLLSNSPFGTGSQPSFITSDPSGKYLFVGNQSNPVIQSFSLASSTGTLTSVATYSVGGTPSSIAVSP